MADRDRAKTIFTVVLLEESLAYVSEMAVFISMFELHERFAVEGLALAEHEEALLDECG